MKKTLSTLTFAVSLGFASCFVFAEDKPMAPSSPANPAPAAVAPAGEAAPDTAIEVLRFVLTSAVQDREPAAEITDAHVGDTVVAFSQVRSGLSETTITHRWLHGDENAGDVQLAVKGSPWRTWSRKTVSESGNWKVQLLNSEGKVLKEAAFTVSEAAAAPAAATPPPAH